MIPAPTKEKTDEVGHLKLLNLCIKWHYQEVKMKMHKNGKIVTKYVSDKVLISRKYKEPL